MLVSILSFPTSARAEAAGLTLELAIEMATTQNEAARSASERVKVAEAQVARARAFLMPDVTVAGTITDQWGASNDTRRDATRTGSVAIDLTLYDARSLPLYRQTQVARDAVVLDAEETRRLLAFATARAFITVLGAEQVAAAAARRVGFAAANQADAEARFEAGLVGSNDVTRAELERVSAERSQIRADASVLSGRLALGLLIVTEITGPLVIPAGLLDSVRDSTGDAPDGIPMDRKQAHARRGDFAAAEKRAEALELAAREPTMRGRPRLNLTGEIKVDNEDRNAQQSLGLRLTWPLWDGGERKAEHAERQALLAIGRLAVSALRREIDTQVQSARVAMAAGQAEIGQAVRVVAAARRNSEETGVLYREGLAAALAVTDANVRLFEAEVEEARANYGAAAAFLDVRVALGLDPL